MCHAKIELRLLCLLLCLLALSLSFTQDRTALHHHHLNDNRPRKRCASRKQERAIATRNKQESNPQDNQAIGDKPCNFPMVWSSQPTRAAGEKIQGLRSMIIIHHLSLPPSLPPLNHKMRKRYHTSGKVPREKTINKQVLPHAPSPTITSFLLSSEAIVVNLKGHPYY